ncbi:MAG: Gfo/Idh/MocA family oxidoreductase [Chloroflexota bacterium]
MEAVRFGIIGCGVIGRRHAQAVAESTSCVLQAVADLRADVAQEIGTQYGAAKIYHDSESLLADEAIEAVVLAMPACYRKSLALQALAQGKHVLTEKPVAMNGAEVQELMAAQENLARNNSTQNKLIVACCSSRYQFLNATNQVTDFLASGALGGLRMVRCRAINAAGPPPKNPPPAWRLNRSLNAGGIMSNWGCYDLDYLLGITGWVLEPQLVLAQTWTVPSPFSAYAAPDSDAETHVTALIRCGDGITISYERAEFVAAQREFAWEIIGEEGSLRLQMTPHSDGKHIHFRADATDGTHSEVLCDANEDHQMVHTGPSADLAQAIRTGKRPQTDLARSLVIQQITDAIYQSAEQGAAVSIT